MIFDEATRRQIDAADPVASTWLSANAGSGKTKVLTDRVARLLLRGVSPQSILCLTYTKAAASEMQNRLFARLGEWAMKPDNELIGDLKALGENGPFDSSALDHARTLFARAVETPGGLRIQTIHSFCAAILRRFPLEAGISPLFREIDERSARLLQQDVLDALAEGGHSDIISGLARYSQGNDFADLMAEIIRNRDHFSETLTPDEISRRFGVPPHLKPADLVKQVFLGDEMTFIPDVLNVMASGKATDKKNASRLASINFTNPGLMDLEALIDFSLSGRNTKDPLTAKTTQVPTKALRESHPELFEKLHALMRRCETARPDLVGLYSRDKALAMHAFAGVFLPAYQSRKTERGMVDFDDLIGRARMLLSDPAVAQWVLFRLDGGLDHILVDEAQDTSPAQWHVIELLAQEFGAGMGAREDVARSIFVVGDVKQSIYSFQGADPREFSRMREIFAARQAATGQSLHDRALEHSFRSSTAILNVVDAVFGGISGFDHSEHRAFFEDRPGRVDLWPLIPPAEKTEKPEWYEPIDHVAPNDHRLALARKIAEQIKQMVETESICDEKNPGAFRPVRFGDFLVLVQRRSSLFHEIIRACKALGLPIAGADRLKVGAELAVRDLVALLSFLTTQDDDLALAEVLRSPLFGLTEAQLYELAHHRDEIRLWPALRQKQDEFPDVVDVLLDMRRRAEFMAPYELLDRMLTRHKGRTKLLARLGPEAEEGIDALLVQAVEYEQSDTPSLTGFLTWLQAEDVEVKRQAESAGDRIRVMTTHGAKGMEAPIVILPDTGDRQHRESNQVVVSGGFPFWRALVDQATPLQEQASGDMRAAQEAERLRLLYVALTRAESWLVVCGSGEVSDTGSSWYRLVSEAMEAAGATDFNMPTGPGKRVQHGHWQSVDKTAGDPPKQPTLSLPAWARAPAPAPKEAAKTLTPSRLEKGAAGATPPGAFSDVDEETALRRGRLLHKLLEYLPDVAPEERDAVGRQVLLSGEDRAFPEEIDDLLSEAITVLDNPALSFLFGPDALREVDLSAPLPEIGGIRLHGTADCLIVKPGRVLVVDFKSNRIVPDSPTKVAPAYLAQMGAYAAALAQIYPDRQIDVAILWTRAASLMPLPPETVAAALGAATTP